MTWLHIILLAVAVGLFPVGDKVLGKKVHLELLYYWYIEYKIGRCKHE